MSKKIEDGHADADINACLQGTAQKARGQHQTKTGAVRSPPGSEETIEEKQ
jgi:hypothetical protein